MKEKCLCVWVNPSSPPLWSQQSRKVFFPGRLPFNILLFSFNFFLGLSSPWVLFLLLLFKCIAFTFTFTLDCNVFAFIFFTWLSSSRAFRSIIIWSSLLSKSVVSLLVEDLTVRGCCRSRVYVARSSLASASALARIFCCGLICDTSATCSVGDWVECTTTKFALATCSTSFSLFLFRPLYYFSMFSFVVLFSLFCAYVFIENLVDIFLVINPWFFSSLIGTDHEQFFLNKLNDLRCFGHPPLYN